jgi:acyl-CoA reductase-like NAD-dependent aldehyde dehydrogenase
MKTVGHWIGGKSADSSSGRSAAVTDPATRAQTAAVLLASAEDVDLFGDSHVYGTDSVPFYTRGKVVTTRWPAPATRGLDLAFPSNAES